MLGVEEGGSRGRGEDLDKDVSQLLKTLLGPLKEVEPISLLSSPQTNQFSGDPTCYFSSPTLNPVTRGPEGGETKQLSCPCSVPAVQPL